MVNTKQEREEVVTRQASMEWGNFGYLQVVNAKNANVTRHSVMGDAMTEVSLKGVGGVELCANPWHHDNVTTDAFRSTDDEIGNGFWHGPTTGKIDEIKEVSTSSQTSKIGKNRHEERSGVVLSSVENTSWMLSSH